MNKVIMLLFFCTFSVIIHPMDPHIPNDMKPFADALCIPDKDAACKSMKDMNLDHENEKYCHRLLFRYFIEQNSIIPVETLLKLNADPTDTFSWGCDDEEQSALETAKRLADKDNKFQNIHTLLSSYKKSE